MNHTMLRSLIDSAEDFPATPSADGAYQAKLVEAVKEHLMHHAKMLKHVFKGRAMPPDVAAFVKECDNYLRQP